MELPQPPQDQDLRNIIDKLAQFVARNGPEFEKMTKTKQKNNPKFSFLYGGEHFNYYQYKVTTEQAILKQAGGQTAPAPAGAYMAQNRQYVMPQQAGATPAQLGLAASMAAAPALQQWLAANSAPPTPTQHAHDIDNVNVQINMLKEQITQSESNLNAQHAVLIQQQQAKINELVAKAQVEKIQMMADENNISLPELDNILQPIIDTCTKDSISSGKGWILQHATSHDAGKVISQHLLRKVTQPGAPFTQKLHIIYLVNDVLHHCARKNAEDLKKNLENVVVPMFCNASIAVTEEQEAKLNKLLRLWESKSNYFETAVIEKMKSPTSSYQEYQNNLIALHSGVIAHLNQQTKSTFENYQSQHQAFVNHTLQQIQQMEMQKHALELQNSHDHSNDNQQPPMPRGFQNNFNDQNFQLGGYDKNFNSSHQKYGSESGDNFPSNNSISGNDNSYDSQTFDQITSRKKSESLDEPDLSNLPNVNFSQPPPGFEPKPLAFQNGLPDLSKPPPGFPPFPEINNEELMPSVPYFELPAGLMVPLIMLEEDKYRPLDPSKIRLPPPAPPNERLLAAVDAFYASPNHERPRDNEGWEKLGLYEYYKAKNAARKHKEEEIASGRREKSRSPTPIPKDLQKQPTPPGRVYRSRSRTPEKLSTPPTRSRSRSPSPKRKQTTWRRDRDRDGRRRSRSKSRSRSRSRSRERHRDSPRSRRVDRSRSPTPPSFMNTSVASTSGGIDSSNKGHQLLQKMGWSAGGLGAAGQGIAEPISGGSVRDRQDQYKGVGVNLNDPYENFRKNKGAAFITRMKERALERSS
ncbi:calcium homeostasis endoplasmic reticulum protein isoform X1 [Epargyreus clarus]|uniref:calcium homeostasis endoplasmic reticulum protein isoform X1 n=2 Tax=Epargyreus clarus TaxID=520877 RepID=UPI003C2AB650